MTTNFDQSTLVGTIVPDVLIKKITLSTGAPESTGTRGRDPHVNIPTPDELPDGLKDLYEGIYEDIEISPEELASSPEKLNQVRAISVLSESSTKIKVSMVVKDTMENNFLTNWFGNNDFSKLIKIRLVQSTNPNISGKFINGQSILSFAYDTIPNSGIQYTDISLVSDSDGGFTAKFSDPQNNVTEQTAIERFFVDIDDRGRKYYDIQFSAEFSFPTTELSHLFYFAVSYIDPQDLAKEFNLSLEELNVLQSEIEGRLITEPVISQGSVINSSVVYRDASDKIWLGEIHVDEQGRYLKGKTTPPGLTEEQLEEQLLFLTKVVVPNIKVHDFRNIDILKSLDFDFDDLEEKLLTENLESIKFQSGKVPIPMFDDIFSEAFFSRDSKGNNRFVFGVNLERMIKKTSVYSRIYENVPESTQLQLLSAIDFKQIIITRRRVDEFGNWFDDTEPDVVISRGISNTGDNGTLKPAPLNISKFIHFQVVDSNVSLRTDGYYKYYAEVVFEDTIEEFLRQRYFELVQATNEIRNFYLEASSPLNYSPTTDTYNINFINDNTQVYEDEIVPLVSVYFQILELLTGPIKDFDLIGTTFNVLLNPKTGSPRGFLSILKLMEDLLDKLYSLLEGSVVNEKVPHSDSTAVVQGSSLSGARSGLKSIKIQASLSGKFDASVDDSTGYEYLFEDKDSSDNSFGISSLSYTQYRDRVEKETLKYFKSLTENLDIEDNSINYTQDDTVETNIYGYLSPIKIMFPFRSPLKQLQTSFEDYESYNEYMAEIMDLNNEDIFSLNQGPVDRTSFNDRSKKLKDKLKLILKDSGFSIDSKLSGNKVQSDEGVQDDISFPDDENIKVAPSDNKIEEADINNVLLSVVGLQELDLEERTIQQFNLNNPSTKKLFGEIGVGIILSAFLGIEVDPIRDLPNQIKSLILSFIKPEIVNYTFQEETIKFGNKYFSMYMNYFNLMKIEYLSSYELASGKPSIKSPVWRILDGSVFTEAQNSNKPLFCRMTFYENDGFKIRPQEKLFLPTLNEYFIINNVDSDNIVVQPFEQTGADAEDLAAEITELPTNNSFTDLAAPVNKTIEEIGSESLNVLASYEFSPDLSDIILTEDAEDQIIAGSSPATSEQQESVVTTSQPQTGVLF